MIKNHVIMLKENLKIFITNHPLLKSTLNFFTVCRHFPDMLKQYHLIIIWLETIQKKMFMKNTFYNKTPNYISILGSVNLWCGIVSLSYVEKRAKKHWCQSWWFKSTVVEKQDYENKMVSYFLPFLFSLLNIKFVNSQQFLKLLSDDINTIVVHFV